jgi:hypothetical protein
MALNTAVAFKLVARVLAGDVKGVTGVAHFL